MIAKSLPSYELIGVGVGPGIPQLMTLQAIDILKSADIIIAPTADPGTEGRAELTVKALLPDLPIHRVLIEIGVDPTNSYSECAKTICGWLDDQRQVAFITLGDPNVFSTFTSISSAVLEYRPETLIASAPGIMAFQYLASATNTVLLDNKETLALVTAIQDLDCVSMAMESNFDTIVVYKGGKYFRQIADLMEASDLDASFVTGELMGLEGERIDKPSRLSAKDYSYLSTMIIKLTHTP